MNDTKLSRCLTGGMTPADRHRPFNGKICFWTTPERLFKLVRAGPCRQRKHCILTLGARKLAAGYKRRTSFASINTGATLTDSTLRGTEPFTTLEFFPMTLTGTRKENATKHAPAPYAPAPDAAGCAA